MHLQGGIDINNSYKVLNILQGASTRSLVDTQLPGLNYSRFSGALEGLNWPCFADTGMVRCPKDCQQLAHKAAGSKSPRFSLVCL